MREWVEVEEKQKEREGGRQRRGGGVWGGGHKSRHIIVTHQPKGSNKGRHAVVSPVLYRASPASSLREERKTERATSATPVTAHSHTHHKILHINEKKNKTRASSDT
ncbi:hypothetical protein ATANTOWER_012177 [Ataeniobius toweri]|uniref:Uncharacterized protein n=1 Tax=Ataeniobius toweri TaxID=208326 RepID=A0ABU7ABE9_9TELE|nr:hypothetical protein [Ataeniobius toweri]